jgi:hypothetical protein
MGNEFGLPGDLILQAIAEIINTAKETPALDQVKKMLEDAFAQQIREQEQQQQVALDNAVDTIMATPQVQAQIDESARALQTQMPI